jgi:small membrane protein
MIKIALSLLFMLLLIIGCVGYKSSKLLGSTVIVGSIAALVLVWNETWVSELAHVLGVGRGADLLLYLWIPLSAVLMIFSYLRTRQLERQLTRVCREIAIAHAVTKQANSS